MAVGKQVVSTAKLFFSLLDIVFWGQMHRFLVGAYSDFEYQLKMSIKFDNYDKRKDFIKRQINIFNELDDDKKVDYFANLTQAVLPELIDQR